MLQIIYSHLANNRKYNGDGKVGRETRKINSKTKYKFVKWNTLRSLYLYITKNGL